jgi:hypothetical protein
MGCKERSANQDGLFINKLRIRKHPTQSGIVLQQSQQALKLIVDPKVILVTQCDILPARLANRSIEVSSGTEPERILKDSHREGNARGECFKDFERSIRRLIVRCNELNR